MILNVPNFISFIQRGTLDYYIDNISIDISSDKVVSKMVSKTKDVVAILQEENNLIKDVTGEFTLNFFEPNIKLKPFLNLIDEEEIKIDVNDQFLKIKSGKQKSKISLCNAFGMTIFGATEPKIKNGFCEIKFDEEFRNSFSKIRKIATRFKYDVYFSLRDGILYLETLDKENKSSSGLEFELQEVGDSDKSIRFSTKVFSNLIDITDESFIARLNYFPDRKSGTLYALNNDSSGQYILAGIQK